MKLGVVIVIYKNNLKEVSIIKTILQEMSKNSSLELLVFENSAKKNQEVLTINKEGYYFYQQTENLGTSGAYSFAIDFFMNLKCTHIALFDQDSVIDSKYFKEVNRSLSSKSFSVAIPKVISNNQQVSPTYFNHLWGATLKKVSFYKVKSFRTAISSGSVHSIDLINQFKPFPKEFWLDYFDHWLFWMYDKNNTFIDILDYVIVHDLSIQNLQNISNYRLKNIYSSEKYFFCNKLKGLSIPAYFLKVFLRTFKILVTKPNQFYRYFKLQLL